MKQKAVILLSGGIDSTTSLAIARSQGFTCYALSIDYHQRNRAELAAAAKVAKVLGAVEHRVIKLEIGSWGGSALTDYTLKIPDQFSTGVPITYVPARNTIFLAATLAWAEVLAAYNIFIGANITDYSNYPDCKPEYLAAFEKMANLATRASVEGKQFKIHAPLLKMTKAEIIKKGFSLGVDYSLTISCYDPNAEGESCRQCDPCRFRMKGFEQAGLQDVTRYYQEIKT